MVSCTECAPETLRRASDVWVDELVIGAIHSTLPARVSAHAPQLSLSPSPYFPADLISGKYFLNTLPRQAQAFKVHDKDAHQGSESDP